MIERLGYVVYWFCCIVAGIAMLGAVASLFGSTIDVFIVLVVVALAVYGIGRAVRYVLVGK